VEYITPALVGLVVLEMSSTNNVLVHLAGGVLFVGRVLHAIGLSNSGGITMLRTLGMILTWLAYIFIIAACLFFAIG
jgi:uncharacterized membrane protein YecN with MAPEG domain